MDWTEYQVSQLKALHLEGLSCSMIAARLGNGITRNAVIGKISRLGLNEGRPPNSTARSEGQKRRQRVKREWSVNLAHVAGSYNPEEASLAKTAIAEPPMSIVRQALAIQKERREIPQTLRPLITPEPTGKVTLFDLTDSTCKWPIGEPGTAAFHFCGVDKEKSRDQPYCPFHARLAFQPLQNRRQANPSIMALEDMGHRKRRVG